MHNKTISDNVVSIINAYRTVMRASLKANEIGLNAMYVKCLSFIYSAQTCTANDIVNDFDRDKAQIARLIKEMIEKKWLIKIANPKDKRSQLLSLTKEGKALAELISQTQHDVNQKMQNNLTKEEIEEFTRIASIISTNLQTNN